MAEIIRLSATQTLVVRRSTPDALELTSTWEPSDKPPPAHWHPHQGEHFEVSGGNLTVELGQDPPRVLSAGEELEVPAATAHRMWNDGPGTTTAAWTITPALRTEELFRFIGRGTGGLRPLAMLIKFRNEYRLGRPRTNR